MTDDLVAFLRARYDDDERQANAAMTYAAATWFIETSGIVTTGPDGDAYTDDREVAEHIARHDPARVLADVDAKRRLLDEHPPGLGYDGHATNSTVCRTCAQDSHDGGLTGDPFPCATLRLLALPYADHPDYRPEWRP